MSSAPFKNILFATDFSSGAAIAREEAVRLARRWDAKLSMIHVLEQVAALERWVSAHPDALSVADLSQSMAKAMEHETEYIDGIDVTTAVIEGESKADVEIEKYVQTNGCDILVIACHRHIGLKIGVRGSSATSIIRTSSIPVMTVRPDKKSGIEAVLAPVEYAPDSEASLRVAIEMALQSDTQKLTILHAYEVPGIGSIRVVSEAKSFAKAVQEQELRGLEKFVAGFDLKGLAPELVVAYGTPHRVVADQVEQGNIDLIVMGTKGRRGIGGFLLGNTAERVLNSTQTTTITMRVGE